MCRIAASIVMTIAKNQYTNFSESVILLIVRKNGHVFLSDMTDRTAGVLWIWGNPHYDKV